MVPRTSEPSTSLQQLPVAASTNGIFYIATGAKFVREAEVSAASAKRIMPDLPVALASDLGSQSSFFDFQFHIQNCEHSFIDKIASLKLSPFERTLFLDTDTILLEPLGDLFDLLDRFDLAAAHEPSRYLYQLGDVPASFPEFNTGVILYRATQKVFEMIDVWRELYEKENKRKREAGVPTWHDQISFTRAVWHSSLRLFALPSEWNFRAPFPQCASGPVRVFHGRLKRLTSDVRFVNCPSSPRLFCPNPSRWPRMIVDTIRLYWLLNR